MTFPKTSAELVRNTSTVSPTTLATVKDALDNLDGRMPPSGTFTPTATLITNLDSATTYVTPYIRIGNVVMFSGIVTTDATAVANCQVDLSLPVASNFAATTQLSGSGAIILGSAVYIIGDATNDRARLFWNATTTGLANLSYIIVYQVI